MVKGLTRETMSKRRLERRMAEFEVYLKEKEREVLFLKNIKLEEGEEPLKSIEQSEVINALEDKEVEAFFASDSEEEDSRFEAEDCENPQDLILLEFHKRRLEVEAEKELEMRVREQVQREDAFYSEQAKVIETELNINEEAFGRVL